MRETAKIPREILNQFHLLIKGEYSGLASFAHYQSAQQGSKLVDLRQESFEGVVVLNRDG